ncbi:hypothetical protein [Streptomyces lavendulae]|uniref:hypothetical protein n=1 Tax=Streptomyces lavendulae TaxID=1914 RepID=UPI0024A08CE5|nr:hypothetical protein [Streptomyces lavendulae]GLX17034.1 hypothetical protein Slala01_06780 [Streptomyces lavendulae subsp. lavendulae]GLX29541.1 hypothetical protein Slala02_53610 [Streptomyces lavendulae subsp. lavendulae]
MNEVVSDMDWVQLFRLGSTPQTTEVTRGHGFCFDEALYHRMHAAAETGTTVTVRVFAVDPASVDETRGCPALGLGLP